MSDFFQTTRGLLHRVDDVVEVWYGQADPVGETYVARLREGGTVSMRAATYEKQFESPVKFMTGAQPGYELLEYWLQGDEADDFVDRKPVIAWAFWADATPVAVTADGVAGGSGMNLVSAGVLQPDGQVVVCGDATYPNEAGWLEEQKREAALERTRQAAARAERAAKKASQ